MGTKVRRVALVQTGLCVACGCCLKVCPRQAIHIIRGMYAEVNQERCVGCQKCVRECPATVITMMDRRQEDEQEVV